MKQIIPKVDRKNVVGMRMSQVRGIELAETHPEIVQEYSDGNTLDNIAQKYSGDYQISPHVAMNAVRYGLIELIGKEEQARIGNEHLHNSAQTSGRKGGTASFEKGVGCFGMSQEKQKQARLKGGKAGGSIAGKRNYENGVGLANLTSEELIENGRKGAIARGLVPYDYEIKRTDYGEMTEKSLVVYLKSVQELPWKKIVDQINSAFGNNRSLESIRVRYHNKWKNLKK